MTEIYRAYDGKGRLIYLGVTNDYKTRMFAHKATSAWYRHAVVFKRRAYGSRVRALGIEDRAIRLLKPIFNVISQADKMSRWGNDAVAKGYSDEALQDRVANAHEALSELTDDEVNQYLAQVGRDDE